MGGRSSSSAKSASSKAFDTSKFLGVKSWFLNKTLTQSERYAWSTGDGPYISKETEKAVLIKNKTDFGTISFWAPKSTLLTDNDLIKKSNVLKKGLNYNEQLVNFAKSNGVKNVRKGMKTKTLIQKIRDSGLDVPKRD